MSRRSFFFKDYVAHLILIVCCVRTGRRAYSATR